MKYFIAVTCSLVALSQVFTVNALPSTRIIRQIPDECRPHFMHPRPPHVRPPGDGTFQGPPPPPPPCCVLPDILIYQNEVFGQCHRFVHEHVFNNQGQGHHAHHKPKLQVEPLRATRDTDDVEETNKESNPHIDKFQEKRECFTSCIFNASGYLLSDDMLNEELLSQKLQESISNETKWSPIVDSVFKKCMAAAKEANSQSQKLCKAGPAEYVKCMNRELFFNCPAELWNNSQECTNMKDRLEKCPNLSPPPPHHSHHPPHHHRSHHHHHHRKHHKNSDNSEEN